MHRGWFDTHTPCERVPFIELTQTIISYLLSWGALRTSKLYSSISFGAYLHLPEYRHPQSATHTTHAPTRARVHTQSHRMCPQAGIRQHVAECRDASPKTVERQKFLGLERPRRFSEVPGHTRLAQGRRGGSPSQQQAQHPPAWPPISTIYCTQHLASHPSRLRVSGPLHRR